MSSNYYTNLIVIKFIGGLAMKKLFTIFLAFALVFSVGTSIQTEATSPTDWWTEQDAKVTPYVYSYLLDNAGFAAYIYTDTKVSMNPQNLSDFKIEEKFEDFFIGKFYNDMSNVLVTKDGLFIAYAPKENAHTIIPGPTNNQHFADLQKAVKIFAGPTINSSNYINFASMESNKAASLSLYKGSITIPAESKINDIGYSGSTKNDYGTIVSGSLQPGTTHSIQNSAYDQGGVYLGGPPSYYLYVNLIDGVEVISKKAGTMNIFYTSNSPIDFKKGEFDLDLNLTNKFVPSITDAPTDKAVKEEINWAVMNGLIRGYEDGSFKPNKTLTESQFVSILAKYFSLNTSLDGESTVYNEDGAYTYLKQYKLPLKGYTNVKERNKPVTRGVVAQVLSMTQGGPSSLVGAYEFLYSNKLTNATTLNAYKSNEGLKRSQISSFFKRMNNADLVEIK